MHTPYQEPTRYLVQINQDNTQAFSILNQLYRLLRFASDRVKTLSYNFLLLDSTERLRTPAISFCHDKCTVNYYLKKLSFRYPMRV